MGCPRHSPTARIEAQARARGYPKLTPLAEPDKGWEGDPTDGNEDLARVVQARQDSCAFSFASKKRARGLWCDDGPAASILSRMSTALRSDDPMPAPRAVSLPLLSPTAPADNWRAFMSALGDPLGHDTEVRAPFGEKLVVSRQMFTHHTTGESKLDKRGRSAYLLYLAEAILRPDEAWMTTGSFGDKTLVLLARFVRNRETFGAVAVFKESGKAWEGWSSYPSGKAAYIETLRDGVLVYRRDP